MYIVCNFVPSQDLTLAGLEVEDLACQALSKPQAPNTHSENQSRFGSEAYHANRAELEWR